MTTNDTKGTEDLPEWLIVKRGLYFRPKAEGYTGVRDEAGRYTEAEARGYANTGCTMVRVADAPEFTPECWPEIRERVLRAKVSALSQEVETLMRAVAEREEWVTHWQTKCQGTRHIELKQRARAEAAEANVAALMTVLRSVAFDLGRVCRAAEEAISNGSTE